MGFDNNKSHWIDTFLKEYEKSFKKIGLFNRKSEYWRFASPLIWYENYVNDKLYSENKSLNLSFNNTGITESFIRFKDGILDKESLVKFNNGEKNIEVSSYKDAVSTETHWSSLKFCHEQKK